MRKSNTSMLPLIEANIVDLDEVLPFFKEYGANEVDLDLKNAKDCIEERLPPFIQQQKNGAEMVEQETIPSKSEKENKSTPKEFRELDIAQHIVDNHAVSLFEGIPYVKIDGVDEPVTEGLLARLLVDSMKVADLRRLTARAFPQVLLWLQALLKKDYVTIRQPRLILFENGAYDFVTGKRASMGKEDFFPVRIRANYCPWRADETPVFDRFLDNCSGGDVHIKCLILAFVGYMLSPCPADKIFLMAPAAGSGKTVLGNLIRELLGPSKTCAIALQNFGKSFEVAQIYGKSANFCLDISSATLSDSTVAMLKQLSGGDPITINAKYQLPFQYRSFAKLVFACNDGGIHLRNSDAGFARRLVVIPFLYSVRAEDMDPELPEKLWEERDGIVTQAIVALRKLHENAYVFPKCKVAERLHQQYTGARNTSVSEFVEDVCTLSPEVRSWTADLYAEYEKFCHMNDMEAVSLNAFSREIHSVPGVRAVKFQQDNRQAQGVQGIAV